MPNTHLQTEVTQFASPSSATYSVPGNQIIGSAVSTRPTKIVLNQSKRSRNLLNDEKLVFPHLPATRMQRMKDRPGVQWKDVSWGLGSKRQHWGRKFHAWFDTQVGTTPPADAEPVLEDFAPGWDGGFQTDWTSASGGSVFAVG